MHFSANDKIAITEAVTGLGLYVDLRDWHRVQQLLADVVTTDYTSVFPGTVATTSNTDLISQWKSMLSGFDTTQHLITNVAIKGSGDPATVLSHVRATHWIADRFWTVGGTYTHNLVRKGGAWTITYIKLARSYEEGDRAVIKEAADRVSALSAR